MRSIAQSLEDFLNDIGPGNPGSMASPTAVIRTFQSYLNGWAHEDLSSFERKRFEEEYSDTKRFCDIFDAGHIKPHHLNAMLGHYAIRHGPGTKGFLKAVGPVMQKLAGWLTARGFWTAEDRRWYAELVGDEPADGRTEPGELAGDGPGRNLPPCQGGTKRGRVGGDLPACGRFAELLHEYVDRHPIDAPEDLPDADYHDDQFTIAKVEPGKLHLDALLEGEAAIVITLPKSVTAKAKAGWSVMLELARLGGKWRILGVGNVYP